jgi:hypothetical protein
MGRTSNASGSGKEAALPSPPPLRTARAPFDACRSSISQALCPEPGCASQHNLHDTHLPPTHPKAGSCTSWCFHRRHLLCFLSWFFRLSRGETPDGSQPGFPWDDLAPRLNPSPHHYSTAFASSIFLYPQPHRLTSRLAFPLGRATGLPRSGCLPTRVRSRLSAGGTSSATDEH